MFYLSVILIFLYAVMCIQDFKYRGISWYLFPAVALLSLFLAAEFTTWNKIGNHFLWNLGFIVLQLVLLSVYFALKERAWVNIVNRYLGIADILLLFVFAMSFSPLNFIIFYCINLFLAAFISLIIVWIKRDRSFKIPLAGIMVLPMIFCLLSTKVIGMMQNDNLISECIMNSMNDL